MLILVVIAMMVPAVVMFIFVVIVMMMLVLLFVLVIILNEREINLHALHGIQNLFAAELLYRCGDDRCLRIQLTDQRQRFLNLRVCRLRCIHTTQDDRAGSLDLILEKLAEVLQIYLCLCDIDNRRRAVQFKIRGSGILLDCTDDIRKLTDTGGLDDHAVRMILVNDLLQRNAEIADQGAADASGIHLLDLNARVLQETAVDSDFTELILNQHDLLSLQSIRKELLDQRSLACTQKT